MAPCARPAASGVWAASMSRSPRLPLLEGAGSSRYTCRGRRPTLSVAAPFQMNARLLSSAAALGEKGPLSGLICLELCSVLAGPTVGQFLAELGAEVVKVENPKTKGDVTRTWRLKEDDKDKPSSYFQSCNLGKKSIALDLVKSEEDRAFLLEDLVPKVDIVLTSYKPGDDKKLGLDYETLLARRPGLIYTSITGYGQSDTRPGYDACLQAEAGFTFMNGTAEPTKMPVALIDLLAAHQLKEGILLALYEKERWAQTAQGPWPGKLIEVSLLGSAVISLANQASAYLCSGKVPQRIGSDHPAIVPYGTVFYDKDGLPFTLAVGTDAQFRSLYNKVIFAGASDASTPDMPAEWSTNPGRCEDRERVKAFLQQDAGTPYAFSHRSRAELLDLCAQLKVPAGSVNDMKQVFEQPEAMSVVRKLGDAGGFVSQLGWRSDRPDRAPDSALRPPCELAFGGDTEELRRRFGK